MDAHRGTRKLLVIELNEFSVELFQAASREGSLPNISRMLAGAHSRTTTVDRVEHQGLDPWVQWVGIHSGLPTAEHGVRRLGLTRKQSRQQLWHVLADRGLQWGVWGAMNAPRGETKGCAFFMPDPWSFDESAYPAELNRLLLLPRYVSKNYLDVDKRLALRYLMRFLGFFISAKWWEVLARFTIVAVRSIARTGVSVHTFTTLLDYLSVLIFITLRRKHRPHFSLIFLNHIAHLQHHFWLGGDTMHPQMKLGLRLCDDMLGLLMEDIQPDEAILALNGLKQINVAGGGDCCYRQKNPLRALQAIGIQARAVEQCMTHDGLVSFESATEADIAEEILRSSALSDGRKAFHVDRLDRRTLFYQIDFDHRVAAGVHLKAGKRSIPFDDVFELVAERTGAHVPEGDVYADGISIRSQIENHEIFDDIVAYFSGNGKATPEPSLEEPGSPAAAGPALRNDVL